MRASRTGQPAQVTLFVVYMPNRTHRKLLSRFFTAANLDLCKTIFFTPCHFLGIVVGKIAKSLNSSVRPFFASLTVLGGLFGRQASIGRPNPLSAADATRARAILAHIRIFVSKWMSLLTKLFQGTRRDAPFTAQQRYTFIALPLTARLAPTRDYMAPLAVDLSSVDAGGAVRPQHVFSVGNGFNVRRVAAYRPLAKMVAFQTERDNGDKHLVGRQMGKAFFALIRKHAVALVVAVILPVPTRRSVIKMRLAYLDLREKTGKNFSVKWQSVKLCVSHGKNLRNRFELWSGLNGLFAQPFRAVSILA